MNLSPSIHYCCCCCNKNKLSSRGMATLLTHLTATPKSQRHWTNNSNNNNNNTSILKLPSIPTAGSLLRFLHDVYRENHQRIGKSTQVCLLMPSLLFGTREAQEALSTIQLMSKPNQHLPSSSLISSNQVLSQKFETLRWKYHGEHAPRPKSIV
jgi:hypothetical protein